MLWKGEGGVYDGRVKVDGGDTGMYGGPSHLPTGCQMETSDSYNYHLQYTVIMAMVMNLAIPEL